MKTISNEEKAKEIAEQYEMSYNNTCDLLWLDLGNVALQAMEWKDERHAQEKQQWIEKACEWLFKNTRFTTNDIRDFKKSMKGE